MLDILKVLADEVRLRILRSVDQAELSVAEIVDALEIPQSTVSRHLKPLKEINLIKARREGTSVYYSSGDLFKDADFKYILNKRLQTIPTAERDTTRVDYVLDIRRRKRLLFFDEVAGQYETLSEPGGGLDALCSAFASGFYDDVVADLGCGEGSLSLMLSRFVKQITCIDQSQKMLNLVYERAKEIKTEKKFTLIKGDLEIIDLEKNKFDSIFLSQSLHHVSDPQKVISKASKSLKDNGKMIILDLLKHDHEWTREQWADQWLGFMPEELTQWLNNENMDILHNEVLRGFVPDLSVIMVIGKKRK